MFWVQDNVPNKLNVRGCRIIFWSNMKQTPGQSWENKDICTCVYMYRNYRKPCLCTSPLLHFLGGKVLMQQIYGFICIMVRWFKSLVVRGVGAPESPKVEMNFFPCEHRAQLYLSPCSVKPWDNLPDESKDKILSI